METLGNIIDNETLGNIDNILASFIQKVKHLHFLKNKNKISSTPITILTNGTKILGLI